MDAAAARPARYLPRATVAGRETVAPLDSQGQAKAGAPLAWLLYLSKGRSKRLLIGIGGW
jgi:hypothetical protein